MYNYSTIKNMREAIYNGMSFEDYFAIMKAQSTNVPSRDKALASWSKAHKAINDSESWRDFMLLKMRHEFDKFGELVDDYYNEGFGYDDISEALGISKEAISEIIQKMELG